MLSDEEKQAIEELKNKKADYFMISNLMSKTLLNLIEKQSKEIEDNKKYRISFSKRIALENKYKEWIKENNILDTRFNLITFLEASDLLDGKKVKKFLEKE